MTDALKLVRKKLINVMDELSKFALAYKGSSYISIYTFSACTANYPLVNVLAYGDGIED